MRIACGVVLALAVSWIGARVWSVRQEHARIGSALALADREIRRLAPALERVHGQDELRAELTERVVWLEARREQQDAPVRMLEEVGRSLPDGAWLTELRQASEVVAVRGRAANLTVLSDFVAGLERSASFAASVDVVDSQVDRQGRRVPVRFELHAALRGPRLPPREAGPR